MTTLHGFQYPLRVEVGCNPYAAVAQDVKDSSFSTLYGSKWVATRYAAVAQDVKDSSFSTLYGSKWVATRSTLYQRSYTMRVSVPSTGRSGLQPQGALWRTKRGNRFQYPLRVEVGCNSVQLFAVFPLYHVSVPSTGRSGLQPSESAAHLDYV